MRSPQEISDLKIGIQIGKRWGYGNLMQALSRAWADMLMQEYGFDEETALQAARTTKESMPWNHVEDCLNCTVTPRPWEQPAGKEATT